MKYFTAKDGIRARVGGYLYTGGNISELTIIARPKNYIFPVGNEIGSIITNCADSLEYAISEFEAVLYMCQVNSLAELQKVNNLVIIEKTIKIVLPHHMEIPLDLIVDRFCYVLNFANPETAKYICENAKQICMIYNPKLNTQNNSVFKNFEFLQNMISAQYNFDKFSLVYSGTIAEYKQLDMTKIRAKYFEIYLATPDIDVDILLENTHIEKLSIQGEDFICSPRVYYSSQHKGSITGYDVTSCP